MWTLSKTINWHRIGTGLEAETKGLIIAAQDQSLASRLYHHKMICRLCNRYDENIDQILSGCLELTKAEYIKRHNNASAYMHGKTIS